MTKLTRNIEIKKKYSDADKLALLQQISEADKVIEGKQVELTTHQDAVKSLKEAIAGQYEMMSDLCARYRLGYESKFTECVAVYENGIATFTDEKTGEIVETRPMNEQEQLQLSDQHRIDAESIIREAAKEMDKIPGVEVKVKKH